MRIQEKKKKRVYEMIQGKEIERYRGEEEDSWEQNGRKWRGFKEHVGR